MTPSERVLLALDANDCLAGAFVRPRARSKSRVEGIVVRREGGATFGTIAGQQTVAELNDLVTLWSYRIGNLDAWYGKASPIWVAKDSAAFVAFTNDWNALHARYATALAAAKSAGSSLIPDAMNPAQSQFDALSKAMRQCYPPDGCPVAKGDWDDLYNRAAAVSASLGIAPPPDSPPQPVATDVDQSAFAATAPLDVVAQVTGAQKAGPLNISALQWVLAHKTLLIVGGAVLAGGIVLSYVAPMLGLAAKGFKGVAALAA